MKYTLFDETIKGMNLLDPVKIRDKVVSRFIPRGYNIYDRGDYFLLISVDGSLNFKFDDYKESVPDESVELYYRGHQVGMATISDMEVVE